MTVLKPDDYVMMADGTHVVIVSVHGSTAIVYDENGYRNIEIKDIVHLDYNISEIKTP